jgi:hypothetical protein
MKSVATTAATYQNQSASARPFRNLPRRTTLDGFHPQTLAQKGTGLLQRKCDSGTSPLHLTPPLTCVSAAGLTVNRPNDQHEQEADRVVNRVIPMPEPETFRWKPSSVGLPSALQRKCTESEGEEHSQIQRQESGSGSTVAPPIVNEVLSSPGQPLDDGTRAFVEPRLGHDFSRVRIHADTKAAESASAVNALAYTVGRDIVFGANQYEPTSTIGRRLLAHELVHVEQQGGNSTGLQRMLACPSRLQGPDPPGWQPYHGNASVFHCGFRGILEDRTPTSQDPQNECFYDNQGTLVDEHQPYSGCRGTPNQYDSSQHPILHALIDSGGIVRAGGPAFVESRMHDVGAFLGGIEGGIRSLYGVP